MAVGIKTAIAEMAIRFLLIENRRTNTMFYPILGSEPVSNQGLRGSWRQLFTTPLQGEETLGAMVSYSAAMNGSYVRSGAAILVAALAATVAGSHNQRTRPPPSPPCLPKTGPPRPAPRNV